MLMNNIIESLYVCVIIYLFIKDCRFKSSISLFSIAFAEEVNRSFYDVLEVSSTASQEEIKKSYRRLVIEFHPDKVPLNATDSEREAATIRFLACQEAYETLCDPASRAMYDMSGSTTTRKTESTEDLDKYRFSRVFETTIKTSKVNVELNINFKESTIDDIDVEVPITLNEILTRVEKKNTTYFHKLICPVCNGNGGLDGQCVTCIICNGSGTATHKYRNSNGEYEQETICSCQACEGRGCIRVKRCIACGGSGLQLTEAWMMVLIPLGFKHNEVYVYPEMGHQNLQEQYGNVVVRLSYVLPSEISLRDAETSFDLVYNTTVPIDDLLPGFNLTYDSPCGQSVVVQAPPNMPFHQLVNGYCETFPGLGLFTGSFTDTHRITCVEEALNDSNQSEDNCTTETIRLPSRGDFHVNIKPNWNQEALVTTFLQDFELPPTDPIFSRFYSVMNDAETSS